MENGKDTSMVARKFPAAPAMTKSIRPNSLIVCDTASSMEFISRTSAEIARHFAPFLSASISFAIAYHQLELLWGRCTVGCRRPRMDALAPNDTRALTWTEHIVPPPPVQKTTVYINWLQFGEYLCLWRGWIGRQSFYMAFWFIGELIWMILAKV